MGATDGFWAWAAIYAVAVVSWFVVLVRMYETHPRPNR